VNRKEAEKAARERAVFHDFIKKKPGSRINPESVESRCPPEPDILCFQENEGNVAFELAEICAQDIACTIAQGGGFLWTSDTSRKIREKLKKITKQKIQLNFSVTRTEERSLGTN
jgi:hypothetical protein